MLARKNRSFLSKKIDYAFIKIKHYILKIANFFSTKSGEVVYNILDIKERSKNLAGVNLELAKNYLQNNNLFDAKLRYKIVLKIKPNNAEALCGLASIYFIEKRMKKSEEYFQKAIPFADKQMQDEIFHSINLIKTFKP